MGADTTTSPRPDLRFLFAHPAHLVALGFGAGLAPKAPGTFGTLAGLALYWILAQLLPEADGRERVLGGKRSPAPVRDDARVRPGFHPAYPNPL